jgi:hypothetical protein
MPLAAAVSRIRERFDEATILMDHCNANIQRVAEQFAQPTEVAHTNLEMTHP